MHKSTPDNIRPQGAHWRLLQHNLPGTCPRFLVRLGRSWPPEVPWFNVIAIARLPDLVRRQAIASGTLVKPAFCRFYSTPALGDKRRVVSVASQKTRNRIYKTLKYVSSGLEIL